MCAMVRRIAFRIICCKFLDEIVLEDIREMARRVTLDEKAIREEFYPS